MSRPAGWIIEAIEKAAKEEALMDLLRSGPMQMFGLTAGQVLWLRAEWLKANPSSTAEDIPDPARKVVT